MKAVKQVRRPSRTTTQDARGGPAGSRICAGPGAGELSRTSKRGLLFSVCASATHTAQGLFYKLTHARAETRFDDGTVLTGHVAAAPPHGRIISEQEISSTCARGGERGEGAQRCKRREGRARWRAGAKSKREPGGVAGARARAAGESRGRTRRRSRPPCLGSRTGETYTCRAPSRS